MRTAVFLSSLHGMALGMPWFMRSLLPRRTHSPGVVQSPLDQVQSAVPPTSPWLALTTLSLPVYYSSPRILGESPPTHMPHFASPSPLPLPLWASCWHPSFGIYSHSLCVILILLLCFLVFSKNHSHVS